MALRSTSWSVDGSSDLATPNAADLDGLRRRRGVVAGTAQESIAALVF